MVRLGPRRINSTGTAGERRRVVSRWGAVYSGADGEADLSNRLRGRPIGTRLRDHTDHKCKDHFKFNKKLWGGNWCLGNPLYIHSPESTY
jgi:hypothetical protein